ncbi:MAG: hypothetical protein HZT41_10920 [Dechloromonas sp.]|jgi:hypothetical protein|nr:MAG: hypothetical protein HZT41_10920 [Dechloromonas sp.]
MGLAGVRVLSLVSPMMRLHTTCPSIATGQGGFHFVDDAAPPMAPATFAANDVDFIDPIGIDHDHLGRVLNKRSTKTCTASGWTRK